MKIGDKKDFLETGTVELSPGVSITICGLPFGFQEEMELELPSPKPPKVPKKDHMGNTVWKNKAARLAETYDDEDDPAYKEAVSIQTRRQVAWAIYHGTKEDPNISWDVDGKEIASKEEFYQAIYDEIKASRIGAGRILSIQLAIFELSGVTEEQMARVKKAFLSAEA